MTRRLTLLLLLGAILFAVGPDALLAQNQDLGAQRLGRPYLFVFIAYAVGWVLIFGWVVSIARKLRAVERKMDRD